MKSIIKLKNKKKYKKCLIVGGGHSVKYFNFDNLTKNFEIIGINWTIDVYVRYPIKYVVCDRKVPNSLTKDLFIDKVKLIGYKEDKVDYYFNDLIYMGDHTGVRALQCAQIMGYKEIYLIGYDYYDIDGIIHYFGDTIHKMWLGWEGFYRNRKEKFRTFIKDFDNVEWRNNIYNCNKKSKLIKFPFKRI